jgi:hypothetical protein
MPKDISPKNDWQAAGNARILGGPGSRESLISRGPPWFRLRENRRPTPPGKAVHYPSAVVVAKGVSPSRDGQAFARCRYPFPLSVVDGWRYCGRSGDRPTTAPLWAGLTTRPCVVGGWRYCGRSGDRPTTASRRCGRVSRPDPRRSGRSEDRHATLKPAGTRCPLSGASKLGRPFVANPCGPPYYRDWLSPRSLCVRRIP